MNVIDHPDHYNLPGKKECIEQMREDYGETITAIFCLTNAYKYLYRAGQKEGNSAEQDIEKAKWYYRYFRRIDNLITYTTEIIKLVQYIEEEIFYDKS